MGCGWCSSLEEQDAVAIHVRKAFAPLSGPSLCMAWKLVPSPPMSQASGIPQCELRLAAELQYPMPSAVRSGGSPAKAASQDGPDFLSLSDGCGRRLPEVEFLEGLGAEALSLLLLSSAIHVAHLHKCNPGSRRTPQILFHPAAVYTAMEESPRLARLAQDHFVLSHYKPFLRARACLEVFGRPENKPALIV